MDLSLSIESFPFSPETVTDAENFLDSLPEDCRAVLAAPVWREPDVSGFAVLAYTEEGKLIGLAVAVDIVSLHQYEWSAAVAPEFRRHSIGSALADGIQHGLRQRGAHEALAACLPDEGAETFLRSLGYRKEFSELTLEAGPDSEFVIPDGVVIQLAETAEEAESVLLEAFDEEILPVLAHNLADPGREVWLMRAGGQAVASGTLLEEEGKLWLTAFGTRPAEQGKGYGTVFLKWCRKQAADRGLPAVMLDVETDNPALGLYRRAGFRPAASVSYWKGAV